MVYWLTAVLIVLKLMGYVAISWWWVFAPTILGGFLSFLVLCGVLWVADQEERVTKRR